MTSRRLVVIRHSKAEPHAGADIERVLAPRGLADASAIGRWLVAHGVAPDCALVSPARRTRQTWQQIAAELSVVPDPSFDSRIYDNSIDDLVAVIAEVPDATETVVLVGHNPSVHGLAVNLDDNTGDAASREQVSSSFPTSALAMFEVDSTWDEIGLGGSRILCAAVPGDRSDVT
jgi:phosphohistidine phosphatase